MGWVAEPSTDELTLGGRRTTRTAVVAAYPTRPRGRYTGEMSLVDTAVVEQMSPLSVLSPR